MKGLWLNIFAIVVIASSGSISAEVVTFPSGKLELHGVVYKPEGKGPFPAVLYNHGSAAGMLSKQAFDALGRCSRREGGCCLGLIDEGRA